MSLEFELCLKRPFTLLAHEALLNIYYSASCLKKKAGEFLRPFGLTDVQFNLMMLLKYQSEQDEGLSQAQLSSMMLVNRANITSLIDRMEKADLVIRTPAPSDRRSNIVKLTGRGKELLAEIEPRYTKEVKRIMAALKLNEQKTVIEMLERIRGNVSGLNENTTQDVSLVRV
ncbi:MAG: MarR family transcriptional regulator [Planctomycetes bacterium]|nr:MarR family transcriptional regulator [Planctomycetota bacterium]MBL7146189.1 MarR family transcriptional regulator [Phycisphaerae bacterium]